VISAVASVFAIGIAIKALKHSASTARHLADVAGATAKALERVEQEQASSVLTVAHEMRRHVYECQITFVSLIEPPGLGQALKLQATAIQDLAPAVELKLRAAGVDLKAVQYTRSIQNRAELIRNQTTSIEHWATLATPEGGGPTEHYEQHWPASRQEVIACTVDIQVVLDRLEAHFPLAYRLLPDTDAAGFLHDLDRELERGREERVQQVLRSNFGEPPPYP
jgi:hypothetical protein